MNKKYILMLCALLLTTLVINGCQLAIEEVGEDYGMDRLCGFYITTESLESSIAFGSMDWTDKDTDDPLKAYAELSQPERFYARAELVNENGITTTKYVFDGIDGTPFFQVIVAGNDASEDYSTIIANNDILDIKNNHKDGGIELEGTIYLSTMNSEIFHFNPVFQTADHEVYMMRGDIGHHISGDAGMSMNYQLETEYKTTENGDEEILTSLVEVSLQGLNPIERIVFREVDKDDELMAITEVTKDAIPETIYLYEDTEYIFVQEHGVNSNGEAVVTRSLIEMDNQNEFESFTCRFINDRGVAEGADVHFKK